MSSTPTNSSQAQVVLADLSEAELRRLVEVLQISHPHAVASALALIQTAVPSVMPEKETVEEVVVERTSKAEHETAQEQPPGVAEGGPTTASLATDTAEATSASPSTPPPSSQEEDGATQIYQQQPADPPSSSDEPSLNIPTTDNADDTTKNDELSPDTAIQSTERPPEEEIVPDNDDENAAENSGPKDGGNASDPNVAQSPRETTESQSDAADSTPMTADGDETPPTKAAVVTEKVEPVVAKIEKTTVQQQQQQQPKKKKKRPPGKKRESKPAASANAKEDNYSPPADPEPLSPPTTEATGPGKTQPTEGGKSNVTPLHEGPTVESASTPGPPSEESEVAVAPSEVLAEEGTANDTADDHSPVATTAVESDPLPGKQQPPESATAVTDDDDTASNTNTASDSKTNPPVAQKEQEQQQQENTAVSDSSAPPKKNKKKRPPGKRRNSGTDNTSNGTSPPSEAAPVSNGSSTATGTISHEVIAWQADPADTVDEDDLGIFFDGHSVTARYQDVSADKSPEAGCYLLFDPQGGGKLVLHYSKTRIAQALGFYAPGPDHSIQGFKFTRNHGRVELIGNCASGLAGRKNYYSGWCQFIRAAKDVNGTLWVYSRAESQPGLDVDVYVYLRSRPPTVTSVRLPKDQPCCVSEVCAVACLPKNAEFFPDVRVDEGKWMGDGNALGTSIELDDVRKPVPSTEGLFIPGVSESIPAPEQPEAVAEGPEEDSGCYLVYDADGCKLIEHYSKTKVPGAIGFYAPGPDQTIPGFKFKSKQGRNELIGNCSSGGVAGRKNYYSGWCQFIRAAKTMNGSLWIYPRAEDKAGLAFDVYVYTRNPEAGEHQTTKLAENTIYNTSKFSAVACLPKHVEFFDGLTMDLTRWVEEGRNIGASLQV